MRYLLKNVLTYRAASEAEAKELIEEAKKDRNFNLSKYSSEYKCVKKKGEIEDEWYRVTLTEEFTAEKEPDCSTTISYNVTEGTFPEPIVKKEYDEDEEYDDDDEEENE